MSWLLELALLSGGPELIRDSASECLGVELSRRYFPGMLYALAPLVEELTGFDMRATDARRSDR